MSSSPNRPQPPRRLPPSSSLVKPPAAASRQSSFETRRRQRPVGGGSAGAARRRSGSGRRSLHDKASLNPSASISSGLGGGGDGTNGPGADGGKSLAWGEHPTSVYVRDPCYSWLPARVVSTNGTGSFSDSDGADGPAGDASAAGGGTVVVTLSVPPLWVESTVPRGDPTLDEELALSSTSSTLSPSSALTRTVELADYPNAELPLQNLDSDGKLLGKPDMADLPFLHEAAILYNLKDRHWRGVPYTRVGDIVVAMNPCQWIDGLYSKEKQSFYADRLIWNAKEEEDEDGNGNEILDDDDVSKAERTHASHVTHDPTLLGHSDYDRFGFEPHVYETSSLAYRGVAIDGQDQTILVSGESGAGKTETVKIVMSHLATVERTRPFFEYTGRRPGRSHNKLDAADTVKRVLESNPVFEAFGNAKTLRNDNSSRFGKFTQLQFDVESQSDARDAGRKVPSCLLAGSSCTTYLLEKSRVVSHSAGERSYHVFYQLLSAPEEYKSELWKDFGGTTGEDYRYIGYADTRSIEGHSDADSWLRTREALSVFGLEGSELRSMMRALCAVLQLGNLTFDHDPAADHEEGGTVVTSPEELSKLSDLLGVDPDVIETAMTSRKMKTRYDECTVHLRPPLAKEGCDALAKEIYARVFDVIVRKVNEYTRAEKHYDNVVDDGGTTGRRFRLISLLDIFGFERFAVNRFEQLCINYANERLQQKYVLDNFKAVQQEYEAEGIEIFDFAVVDNSDVLTLLEGKIGLIVSLNEECIRPKGSDTSFVYKVKLVHSDSEYLIQEKLHKPTEFGVYHFAGPVTYDATKFVERNTDKLPQDLMDCATKSDNELVRDEFRSLSDDMHKGREAGVRLKSSMITNHTVMTKFRTQLSRLMSNIEDTRTRYIRCIKPNEGMTPKVTDHYTTMRQLECAGLVTAITISRESFPNRLGYDVTMERFRALLPAEERAKRGVPRKAFVEGMLRTLLRPLAEVFNDGAIEYPFACGKTRVYFRAGALERLETDRMEYYTARATSLQRWARRFVARRKFETLRKGVILLQARARGAATKSKYRRDRAAALTAQCWLRCVLARRALRAAREHRAAVIIQSRWRINDPKETLAKWRAAAVLIQRCVRKMFTQVDFTAKLATFVEEARMDHKLTTLQQQVTDEQSVKGAAAVDERLLEEIETMFDYLRKEIYTLRGVNSDLRAELKEAEADKRALLAHAESAEAASSLSRLRVSQLTKTNTALIAEVMGHKQEVSALKRELKNRKTDELEDIAEMKEEFEGRLAERDHEINMLKENLKTTRSAQKFENEMLKDELAKAEEDHVAEVMRLKDELKRTQDSHHDYLAKLMDVLETTHAARETETARINEELNSVRHEKDAEIAELQREVETLRRMNQSEAAGLNKKLKKRESDIRKSKQKLERNVANRSQRSRKFDEMSKQLEQQLAAYETHQSDQAVSRSILGRKKKSKSEVHSVEDTTNNMKRLLRSMRDLYELEQNSHAQVDDGTLQMMDDYLVVTEPDIAMKNMKESLRAKESENDELKRQLDEKFVCRACEFRTSRASGKRGGFKHM